VRDEVVLTADVDTNIVHGPAQYLTVRCTLAHGKGRNRGYRQRFRSPVVVDHGFTLDGYAYEPKDFWKGSLDTGQFVQVYRRARVDHQFAR